MSAARLQANSENRFFDRITVVTNRLEETAGNLEKLYGLKNWKLREESRGGFSERTAVAYLGNVELCLTQPLKGESVCSRYLTAYGEGLFCLRENVPPEKWEAELTRYKRLGVSVAQEDIDAEGVTVWLDTQAQLGGMLALHRDSEEAAETRRVLRNDRVLTQINVVTGDVDRTIHQLTELLEMGPWSIGTLNNQSVANPGLLVNGKLEAPEFHFQLGITVFANIEIEVIQPVKGPTVYQEYLDRHGVGFHHIKEIVPVDSWQSTLDGYAAKGIALSIKGGVGDTSFAYLDCEKLFGFVVELGIPVPPGRMPDGYNEYHYP